MKLIEYLLTPFPTSGGILINSKFFEQHQISILKNTPKTLILSSQKKTLIFQESREQQWMTQTVPKQIRRRINPIFHLIFYVTCNRQRRQTREMKEDSGILYGNFIHRTTRFLLHFFYIHSFVMQKKSNVNVLWSQFELFILFYKQLWMSHWYRLNFEIKEFYYKFKSLKFEFSQTKKVQILKSRWNSNFKNR